MKILVFDNYDSFTYNLVHLIQKVGYHDIEVHRNDKLGLKDINKFDKILLSPGPGIPSEAGSLLKVIEKYAPSKSILGVCLGHQAIAEVFGGKLTNMKNVLHGVTTTVKILNPQDSLFNGLPKKFKIGHYHSWIVDNDLPESLIVTAINENNDIMAIKHKKYDVLGVQFHPESILTEYGEQIIKNWLIRC
ncbi:MAG: aminodeoxychorismate/anthranilate synthase component II [Bacteroidetes bacterium]|nr:aminodeoxychorismate/anthranilate synthase component II [Bacteroidota bacterium]